MRKSRKLQLFQAAEQGNLERVKALLRIPSLLTVQSTKDRTNGTILHAAAAKGHIHLVQWLLESGHVKVAGEDKSMWEKFWRAFLFPLDVNAEAGGKRPLWLAAMRGHVEVVKELLDFGADPTRESKYYESAFHAAVEQGHLKIVEMILRQYPLTRFISSGRPPLLLASKQGHVEIVELLVNLDPKCKYKYTSNLTALHVAAEEGHLVIVEFLLKAGAHVNAQASSGQLSPLHSALLSNKSPRRQIVKLLIESGADVNAKGPSGMTPLHYSAKSRDVEIVKMILAKWTADVNSLNADKATPILEASRVGDLEIVQLLLENGADPSIRNSEKLSALSCAMYEGHGSIVDKLLERHNATSTEAYIDEIVVVATVKGYRARRKKIQEHIEKLEDKVKRGVILDRLRKKEKELVSANPNCTYILFNYNY